MSKKKGKNRPPRIDPPQPGPKALYQRPCTNCFRLVPSEEVAMGICARCQRPPRDDRYVDREDSF